LTELSKRLVVAGIGIPAAIGIIFLGGIYFAFAIAALSSITLWEFYSIVEKKEISPNKILGILFNVIFILSIYLYTYPAHFSVWKTNNEIFFLEILVLMLSVFIIQLFSSKPNAILNITATLGGIAYISVFYSCLIFIRKWNLFYSFDTSSIYSSEILVISIFASVWSCDSAAYFIGRKFGRHKLMPLVSPKKSWEGAIAGFFGSIIAFVLLNNISNAFSIYDSICIGALIGIFGQIGDLAESQLKRDAGVKDSSALIPGHGGFLDRFDSILFVSPVVLIYLYFTFVRDFGF
jgi:phosphatidate cytidylyltransferase